MSDWSFLESTIDRLRRASVCSMLSLDASERAVLLREIRNLREALGRFTTEVPNEMDPDPVVGNESRRSDMGRS
jgi:hypothetical protein